MNQSEAKTLWIAVGAGVFAAFLLYSYTQEKSKSLTDKFGAKTNVVVAKRDINEMETIDESMVQIIDIPETYKQPSAINNPELAVGRVALVPISEGEQILENKMQAPGKVTGLSLQVQPGMRALTIPIDDMRGVAKLLKPGDRIDLIAAFTVGSALKQRREVKTIMQNIPILATGLRINNELPRLFEKLGDKDFIRNLRSDTAYNTITIEVNPKKSQDLIYILSNSPGDLFITLRHPSDHKQIKLKAASLDSVLDKTKIIPPRKPASIVMPAPQPKPKPKPKNKRGFIDL